MILKVANSFPSIAALYAASLLLGGLSFAFLEHRSIGDGLWWAIVTALTIGYGDLSPVTPLGRIVAAVFQHFWVYGMVPLIAVNLLTHVVRDEHRFSDAEQRWHEAALRAIAAKVGAELPPAPTEADE